MGGDRPNGREEMDSVIVILIDTGIGEASNGSSLRTFDQSAPGDAEKSRSRCLGDKSS
jgi:hypothetical protein